MSTSNEREGNRLSPEARARLENAVREAGGQSAVARTLEISRQGLNGVLRGSKGVSDRRLEEIAAAAGVTVDFILNGPPPSGDSRGDTVSIPIVEIEASAGPGLSTAMRPSTVDYLPMPEWLARRLGPIDSLEVVTARGDSGAPEISDGDLVMLDKSKPYRGEALYVIVLDGDLAIKRLQREAGGMRVLSRNPAYPPIEIPAGEVDERLRVLGRVVWSGKTY
jgi:phage repressor protein C with HTH and peptisase S24 domain